jgi:alpha-amylase
MIKFKNIARNSTIENWWDNENNMIAFSRGSKAFIVFNLEQNSIDRIFKTGLPQGIYCEISSGNKINNICSGKKISVDANGNAKIYLPGNSEDGFLAIHVGEKL